LGADSDTGVTDETRSTRRLGRYVPRLAANWDEQAPGRRWQAFDATLCFVDISGFTPLSERLARRGRIGAEELTELLNRVFGNMLGLAYQRGGGLLKFGGDALLMLFNSPDHAAQAASAAVEMRAALRDAAAVPTSVGRVALRMSVGLHSGLVHVFRVGHSHQELLIAGPAASETTRMEHVAGPGQIVVSTATRRALPARAAEVACGPGWLLRWRQPKVPTRAPVPTRAVAGEVVASYLPVTLRRHLSEPSREPEHRVATVAFLQFGGVDQRLAADGPDSVADALEQIIGAVQTAAEASDVTFLATDIDEDGGKIMLATGVPSTGADDEGRMLRCLRRIADSPLPLPIRMGVNRGHVFTGEVGMVYRSTFSVMGDTVNTAARLMAAAPPGSVYAGADVVERARTSFASSALEPLTVKGKAAPLRAFAVGPEVGRRTPTDDRALPFVGREAERAALHHHLDQVVAGKGGLVMIEGDAGVGKSRLVSEVLHECADADDEAPAFTVLTVHGESYGVAFPHRALRDTVRDLLHVRRADPREMATALLANLQVFAPELLPVAPLIAEVAHVEVPSTPEVDELEPRFRPDRQADAIIRLLALRIAGPLVVVVEDAHWIDDASANLLDRVAASATGPTAQPWLVVGLRRPGAGAGLAPTSDDAYMTIALGPLRETEASELVWSATDAVPLRPHDVRAIVIRAAGNPLFLQELLRHVGQLATTNGHATLPDTLEAVLGAQIDSLPREARQVLRCAAVLGRSFRAEALELIVRPDGIAIGAVVESELSDFIEIEQERWRFRQALARDVAYEGLSYRRRAELHRRAGAATERLARGRVEQVADLLARHYAASQDVDLAWRYGRLAARRARAAYANEEAATHYEQALEAVRRLPDVSATEKAAMWTGLGDVREQLGMYAEAVTAYRRAAVLVRGDPAASARLALRRGRAREQNGAYAAALREVRTAAAALAGVETEQADRWRARLTAFEAAVRQGQERPREALAVAERAAEAAGRCGERFALAQAYGVLDWALIFLGRPSEAVFAPRALALYEELGDLSRQALILNNLGAAAYYSGHWDDAAAFYERSKEASRRAGNEVQAALGALNLGEILVNQGRLDDAQLILGDAVRVLRASGSDAANFAGLQLGRVALDRGDLIEAERLMTKAQLDSAAIGRWESAREAAIHLSHCHLRRGDPAMALETLRAAERAARGEVALFDVQAAEVETMILLELDLLDDARAVSEAAIADARRQGLIFELALLLLERAAVEVQAGDPVDHAGIDEAVTILRQLGCEGRLASQLAMAAV
jgi:class 3 adenylate cyclase/tetratricopeptide (TPR) repeat protein